MKEGTEGLILKAGWWHFESPNEDLPFHFSFSFVVSNREKQKQNFYHFIIRPLASPLSHGKEAKVDSRRRRPKIILHISLKPLKNRSSRVKCPIPILLLLKIKKMWVYGCCQW
jgi:hypothetical protein